MNSEEGLNKVKDVGKDRVGEAGARNLGGVQGRMMENGGERDEDRQKRVNECSRNTKCEPEMKGKELRQRWQIRCA